MDSQTNRERIARNLPLLLTPQEMADPLSVIQGFMVCFDLESLRRIHRVCLFNVLGMDDEQLGIGVERPELAYYFEVWEIFIEAVYCHCIKSNGYE